MIKRLTDYIEWLEKKVPDIYESYSSMYYKSGSMHRVIYIVDK